jgi:hypothetical protein
MANIVRILSTEAIDLTAATAETVAAKSHAWTARIIGDVPLHVFQDHEDASPVADADDYLVNEFDDQFINVGAGEELSVFSDYEGTVWVSEVKVSS